MGTHFEWDPVDDVIICERDDDGNILVEYNHEPGYHGRLISENRAGVHKQYHYDAAGNVIALTDDTQTVTDTIGYSAFGDLTERTGSTPNPFQFRGALGYYANPLTNEYDVRARVLSPISGRWLTVDPLGTTADEINPYCYVLNSRINRADPSGLLGYKDVEEVPTGDGKKTSFLQGECGEYSWSINWELSDKERRLGSGYILQQVILTTSVKNCKNQAVPLSHSCPVRRVVAGGAVQYQVVYYEIWKFVGGEVFVDAQNSPPRSKPVFHDYFSGPKIDESYGCHFKRGEAFVVKDLRGLADLRQGAVKEAGDLFALCDLPGMLTFARLRPSAVDKSAKRVVLIQWDCCPPVEEPKCYHGPPDREKEIANDCSKS